jgi:hypothetical protein
MYVSSYSSRLFHFYKVRYEPEEVIETRKQQVDLALVRQEAVSENDHGRD